MWGKRLLGRTRSGSAIKRTDGIFSEPTVSSRTGLRPAAPRQPREGLSLTRRWARKHDLPCDRRLSVASVRWTHGERVDHVIRLPDVLTDGVVRLDPHRLEDAVQ